MIRKPAVAGKFYEARPEKLRAEVKSFLKPGIVPAGRAVGFLSPHAGYTYSGAAAGVAFAPFKNFDFDTLVIMATGHTMGLLKGALLAKGSFETPLGVVEIDSDFCSELLKEKKLFEDIPQAHEDEHAVEVQLPFLQALKGNAVKIVPLLFNSSDVPLLEETGRAIGRAMKGRKALFCVSSDLSHYPPGKIAEISDRSVLLALRQAMRNSSPAYFEMANSLLLSKTSQYLDTTACGQAAMTVGAAAALELGCNDFELALYTHSGKVSGDESAVVGYGAGYFTEASPKPAGALDLSPEMKNELLALARKSISAGMKTVKAPQQPLSPRPEFNQPAAIFVTLTLDGDLRGCIGSLEPRAALSDMVASYACSAAFEDPRFERVSEAELKKINIEISVLSPLERIKSADAVKPGVHGVYVRSGRRSGTYLPQVWEHFKKKEDFLSSLCMEKAGLAADAWKGKDIELYTYTVNPFTEK
ncbi:MAG: AmmeMemoRadiSam system protein B [Elusimicrobiales bacterium]|nr:AmmeMemoRadiSam system protein B [Elusimicrobiales bacterium]